MNNISKETRVFNNTKPYQFYSSWCIYEHKDVGKSADEILKDSGACYKKVTRPSTKKNKKTGTYKILTKNDFFVNKKEKKLFDEKFGLRKDDLKLINPENISLKYVYVGLNISMPIKTPFGNFHNDKNNNPSIVGNSRNRSIMEGTLAEGCYMTDLIKNVIESNSTKLPNQKKYKLWYCFHIALFVDEINVLEINNPILLCFNKKAYDLLKEYTNYQIGYFRQPDKSGGSNIRYYYENKQKFDNYINKTKNLKRKYKDPLNKNWYKVMNNFLKNNF